MGGNAHLFEVGVSWRLFDTKGREREREKKMDGMVDAVVLRET
jgi:hypothetical protein